MKLISGRQPSRSPAGEVLAQGRANRDGRFVARVTLPTDKATVRLRAVGQFPALRSGTTTLTLR